MKKKSLNLKTPSLHKVQELAWTWWTAAFRYIALALALGALVFVGYTWYANVYALDITPEEQAREIHVRQDAVRFHKEEFVRIVEMREQRAAAFQAQNEQVDDVFFPDGAPVVRVGDQ